MNAALVDQVVAAVLYEGYILYPYRASSRKNRQRFTFGRIYPEVYSRAQQGAEPCAMQTECLVRSPSAAIEISVRFLQPMWREALMDGAVVSEIEVNGKRMQSWQEAVEREVRAPEWSVRELLERPRNHEFTFEASETREPEIFQGVGIRRRQDAICGVLEIAAEAVDAEVSRITVRVVNRTPLPEAAIADQDADVRVHAYDSPRSRWRIYFAPRYACRTCGGGGGVQEYRRMAGARRRRGEARTRYDARFAHHFV
jgi:hypothetical protein